MKVTNLTYEEKLGQMLMIGISSKEVIEDVVEMIEKLHIGGVLLYKNNYSNHEEMVSVIEKLQKANEKNKIPLFIGIDQEGGIVNRMPNEYLNIYSAQKLAKTNEKIVKKAGHTTAIMLKNVGINMNFAPVLDLQNEKNKGLGSRCFSKNPDIVANYSYAYMEELNKNNIISVVKHFPGHGCTSIDSHIFMPIIKEYKKLNKDIKPFKYIIEKDCEILMVSHMIIKDIDKYNPCSLSKKFIKEKIRKELSYKGIIITDEIRMHGVKLLYGKNRAIIKAIKAGNDMVLIKYRKNDINIIKKLKNHIKEESSLDERVERIINLKKKYKLETPFKTNTYKVEEINEKIKEINKIVEKTLEQETY